jgi:hypothetical protein
VAREGRGWVTDVRPELVTVGERPEGVVLSVLTYPEAGHGLMHLGVLRVVLERLVHESLALALRIVLEAAFTKRKQRKRRVFRRNALLACAKRLRYARVRDCWVEGI